MQYGIFFASAGHASLIDYPDAKGLQKIAADMYTQGDIISSVYASPTLQSISLFILTSCLLLPFNSLLTRSLPN